MKMMDRTMPGADGQAVGSRNRAMKPGMGGVDRIW